MQELTLFITNHPALSFAALVLLVLLLIVEVIRMRRSNINITPSQATHLINHQNAVILDLRSEDAYRKSHIIDAYAMNAKTVLQGDKKLDKFKSRPLIIVCPAGVESQKIATALIKRGYQAYSLKGGMRGWMSAQMPVVKD